MNFRETKQEPQWQTVFHLKYSFISLGTNTSKVTKYQMNTMDIDDEYHGIVPERFVKLHPVSCRTIT